MYPSFHILKSLSNRGSFDIYEYINLILIGLFFKLEFSFTYINLKFSGLFYLSYPLFVNPLLPPISTRPHRSTLIPTPPYTHTPTHSPTHAPYAYMYTYTHTHTPTRPTPAHPLTHLCTRSTAYPRTQTSPDNRQEETMSITILDWCGASLIPKNYRKFRIN